MAAKAMEIATYAAAELFLHYISDGNLELATKILVEANIDINVRDKAGLTGLMIAAKKGYANIVDFLINAKADLNVDTPQIDDDTILVADDNAQQGNTEFYGARHGNNALLLAVEYGHIAIFEALLEAGADLNTTNEDTYSAIEIAARNGHIDIVKCILAAIEDNRRFEGVQNINEALSIAAAHGHLAIFDCLIQAKANIHQQCILTGENALELAISNKHYAIVEYILKAGAALRTTEEQPIEMLHSAASHNDIESLDILLKYGVDVNARLTSYFDLVLMFDLDQSTGDNVYKIFVRPSEDFVTYRSWDSSHPPIDGVIDRNELEQYGMPKGTNLSDLQAIKKYFFKVTDARKLTYHHLIHSQTALIAASKEHDNVKAIDYLINAHADINAVGEAGLTALMHACLKTDPAMVNSLVKAKADLNARDEKDSTALQYALSKCYNVGEFVRQRHLYELFALERTNLPTYDSRATVIDCLLKAGAYITVAEETEIFKRTASSNSIFKAFIIFLQRYKATATLPAEVISYIKNVLTDLSEMDLQFLQDKEVNIDIFKKLTRDDFIKNAKLPANEIKYSNIYNIIELLIVLSKKYQYLDFNVLLQAGFTAQDVMHFHDIAQQLEQKSLGLLKILNQFIDPSNLQYSGPNSLILQYYGLPQKLLLREQAYAEEIAEDVNKSKYSKTCHP